MIRKRSEMEKNFPETRKKHPETEKNSQKTRKKHPETKKNSRKTRKKYPETGKKHLTKKKEFPTAVKEFQIYSRLLGKRILKRPLFLLVLLLLPAAVLFLQNCKTGEDSLVRVALYSPEQGLSSPSEKLIEEMLSLSNASISFFRCQSEKELIHAIAKDGAACGYILPAQLDEKIQRYAKDRTPFLRTIRSRGEISTKIVDEIVLGKIYQSFSYYLLSDFLKKQTGTEPDEEELSATFQTYQNDELLFTFEYIDGTGNTILNDKNSNYMMLPVRGIISVFVLLAAMAGAVLWYTDSKRGILAGLPRRGQYFFQFLSLFLPALFSGIAGLITLKIAGLYIKTTIELPAMLGLIFCCCALVHLLRKLFRKREFFLASIPVFIIGSLILCPVFLSVETFFPKLALINRIFPAACYLNSLYGAPQFGFMFLYCAACLILADILSRLTSILWPER